jgi:thiol-disulfide isomerase/thioredoxin
MKKFLLSLALATQMFCMAQNKLIFNIKNGPSNLTIFGGSKMDFNKKLEGKNGRYEIDIAEIPEGIYTYAVEHPEKPGMIFPNCMRQFYTKGTSELIINATFDPNSKDNFITNVTFSNSIKENQLLLNNSTYSIMENFYELLSKNANYEKSDLEEMALKVKEKFNEKISNDLDATFIKIYLEQIDKTIEETSSKLLEMKEGASLLKKMSGNPSPLFTYENHKGGKTSLEDFKGKYVYIDLWATWCAPCIAEIPALKELEKSMEGKNIVFVSISIDTKKDYDKWKNIIAKKQLGGVQLIADKDWSSEFIKKYFVNSIPRFILIDPNGNIVNPDAPRPSDKVGIAQLLKDVK